MTRRRIVLRLPDGRERPIEDIPGLVAVVAVVAMPDGTLAASYAEQAGTAIERESVGEALVDLGLNLKFGREPAAVTDRPHATGETTA